VYYSASCGGRSEEASQVWPDVHLPYLQSHKDDVHDDEVPWTVELSLADMQRALARAGFVGERLRDVSVASRNGSGRVSRVHLAACGPTPFLAISCVRQSAPRSCAARRFPSNEGAMPLPSPDAASGTASGCV
jgi:peptidoglycan hydrolase-like amidase